MSGRILPDTSVWIDFFHNRNHVAVERLAAALETADEVVVASLVAGELFCGLDKDDADTIRRRFAALEKSPELEFEDFLAAADLFRRCRSTGRMIRGYIGCLIAQLCLRWHYQLLTTDRDFEKLAEIAPLQLIPCNQGSIRSRTQH